MRFTHLAAAALAVALSAPAAFAATISASAPTTNFVTAKAAETAFLAGKTGVITETFEGVGFTAGATAGSFNTAVGTFTSVQAGQLGQSLRILSKATTPFQGRRDMTAANNSAGKWLDSNDSKEVDWTLDFIKPVKEVGFFLTDVNDVSGNLKVTLLNGKSVGAKFDFAGAGGTRPNGEMVYVTALFDGPATKFTFTTNTKNDGWGIDNISAVPVPLPAAGWMLLSGLAAMAGLRRARGKKAAA
jgi:hypothetical protein